MKNIYLREDNLIIPLEIKAEEIEEEEIDLIINIIMFFLENKIFLEKLLCKLIDKVTENDKTRQMD